MEIPERLKMSRVLLGELEKNIIGLEPCFIFGKASLPNY